MFSSIKKAAKGQALPEHELGKKPPELALYFCAFLFK